jgi:hypothetical protein
MATKSSLQFLAGIKPRPFSEARDAVDIASARYADSMRAQSKQVSDMFNNVIADIKDVTADVLYEALQQVFDLSQDYVPVDTGDLKESGFLEKQTFPGGCRVVMGYGRGGDPGYATLVHERVDIAHEAPTRSKFLLAAIEEKTGDVYADIVRAMRIP